MKTLTATLLLLLTIVSSFGQGCLGYSMYTGGAGKEKRVYGIDPSDPWSSLLGGPRVALAGDGYSAELFWGKVDATEADLQPVEGSVTGFKTSMPGTGMIVGSSKLCLAGVQPGEKVTLQLRAWDNQGGTLKTWADLLHSSSAARGESVLIRNYELAGLDSNNIPHVGTGHLSSAGLQSFGLHLVPEASPLLLTSFGLIAVGLLRRKPASRTASRIPGRGVGNAGGWM